MSLVFCFLKPWTWIFNRYELSRFIVLACAIYVETVSLCFLLMIRFTVLVANVIDKPSAALAKPFDFFAMSNGDGINRLIDRLCSSTFRLRGNTTTQNILLEDIRCVGFVLWTQYLRGSQFRSHDGSPARSHHDSQVHSRDQHWFVFILRCTGIAVVVISLLAVLFTNLVLDPVHETGLSPLKLSTTSALPISFAFEADDINWSIIPVSKIFVLKICLFRTVTACCR